MWESSPKPDRCGNNGSNAAHVAFLGFVGLLLEAVGVWLVFSWATGTPQRLDDPALLVGGILTVVGFVVLTRWLAAVVKTLVKR